MENQTVQNKELPEAPASASMKVKSPNGAEYIFTMRDEKASVLLFKMAAMEDNFLKKGFTFISQDRGSGRSGGIQAKSAAQATCQHLNKTAKKSSGHNKPENAGKIYESCLDCDKWLGWKEVAPTTSSVDSFERQTDWSQGMTPDF